MKKKPNALFLTLLIGTALVGAGLIWSIPALFSPHEPYQVWVTGILGGLFVILAVGTLYLRPPNPRSSHGKADE